MPIHSSTGNVWCKVYFDILNRLGTTHECDGRHTDRQTSWQKMQRFTQLHSQKSCPLGLRAKKCA